MPLRIKCPAGHTLIVPDDRAGRTLKCPRCDQSVVVPSAKAAPARSSVAVLNSAPHVQDELLSLIARDVGGSQAPAAVAEKVEARRGSDDAAPQRIDDAPTRPIVKPKSRALPLPAPPQEAPPELLPPELLPAQFRPLPAATAEAPLPEPALLIAPAEPLTATEHAEALPAEPLNLLHDTARLAADEPAPPVAEPTPPVAEEPAPPPFVPRSEPATVSLHADAASTLAVYQLVAALVAAAVFSVVPAVWDLVEYLQVAESQFVARWALGLLFLGVVQLAYAVYLFQLPDWTTVWVVTVFSLVVAAIYAAVLGLVLLSSADGFLVGEHGLQLADKLAGGKAALWCLCMVSLSTILAFFSGRLSTRWHKTEMVLRACA